MDWTGPVWNHLCDSMLPIQIDLTRNWNDKRAYGNLSCVFFVYLNDFTKQWREEWKKKYISNYYPTILHGLKNIFDDMRLADPYNYFVHSISVDMCFCNICEWFNGWSNFPLISIIIFVKSSIPSNCFVVCQNRWLPSTMMRIDPFLQYSTDIYIWMLIPD